MAGDGTLSTAPPALAVLFAGLERAGIRYAVLRNYDGWPTAIGKDVDLIVHQDDLTRAHALIESVAMAHRLERRRSGHVRYLLLSNVDGTGHVLDVRPDLMHDGLPYLAGSAVLGSRRRHGTFFVPSPALESLALLLHCVIDAREIRDLYRARLGTLGVGDAVEFRRAATAAVGPALAGRLAECLARAEPERALPLRACLLRACARRNRHALSRWLHARCGAAWGRGQAMLRPPGRLVVVLGPDGAGKTTTTELVARRLARQRLPVITLYLGAQRPLLPTRRLSRRLRQWLAAPGAATPIRDVDRRRRLRGLVHVLADQWLRYLVYVRPRLVRGHVVVLDRYFYDLRTYPHPVVRRRWMEAMLMRLVPRPALVFCLTGDAAVIARRKGELTVAETARQLDCYRGIGRWVPSFHEIPADGDTPSVVRWMSERVVRLYTGAPEGEQPDDDQADRRAGNRDRGRDLEAGDEALLASRACHELL
jgi:thymidylate kinase